ncbi:MAG: 3'-5' exonuclease [Candidatus Altimarinota bacterium]
MKIIVFDTETTGFPTPGQPLEKQPYLCQFAAITLEYNPQNKSIIELNRTDILIKPPIAIPAESTNVHGITDAMVATQKTFPEQVAIILNLFKQADIAIAHNLIFDQQIIEFELERAGLGKNFLPSQTYDSMKETKGLCKLPGRNGNYKSPRLMELHQFLVGQPFQEAHNAMKDVEALSRCVRVLLEQGFYQPVLLAAIPMPVEISIGEQISLF